MNKKIISAISLILVMFVASCQSNDNAGKSENTETAQPETALYQCPMKCEGDKTYAEQGQCPVCNMELVQL